jgi:hypothetical protein
MYCGATDNIYDNVYLASGEVTAVCVNDYNGVGELDLRVCQVCDRVTDEAYPKDEEETEDVCCACIAAGKVGDPREFALMIESLDLEIQDGLKKIIEGS